MQQRQPYSIKRILAQARPVGVTSVTLLTKGAVPLIFGKLFICNNTAGNAVAGVFLDGNGTTYDETTCIVFGLTVLANTTKEIDFRDGGLSVTGGTIGIQTGTGNALTFTLMGEEITL